MRQGLRGHHRCDADAPADVDAGAAGERSRRGIAGFATGGYVDHQWAIDGRGASAVASSRLITATGPAADGR